MREFNNSQVVEQCSLYLIHFFQSQFKSKLLQIETETTVFNSKALKEVTVQSS